MPKKANAPTKAELAKIASGLRPGKRVTVGTGITMTKDASGRLRFQWRARIGGRDTRNASDTCDSYEAAVAGRDGFLAQKGDNAHKRRERGRKMKIDQLFPKWWEHVATLEPGTSLDYGRVWKQDIHSFFKGMTLGLLLDFDYADWETWLKEHHVKSDGTLAKSAIEKAYKILGTIFNFAVEENYLPYNPLDSVQKKRRRRDKQLAKKASKTESTHVVLRSEIPTPLEVEKIRLWLPGQYPIERLQRRALITVLAWLGLRPGEALFLRWYHVRNLLGPLGYIKVRGALKDIAGYLIEGETKTHTVRDALSFPFVDRELDALYLALGSPDLDARVFGNRQSGPMRWDNFRGRPWYSATQRAGIAKLASASDPNSFPPYWMRHHAASVFLHAVKPDGSRYSPNEIAETLGNSVEVLLTAYAKAYDTDFLEVNARTIEEFAVGARYQVCGPLPGDPDFQLRELTTVEASALTGIPVNGLGGRCARGTLSSRREGSRYLIAEHDLMLAGLLDPGMRADQPSSASTLRRVA